MTKKSNTTRRMLEAHLTIMGWEPVHRGDGVRWERGYGIWHPEMGVWMTRNQNGNYVSGNRRAQPQPSLAQVEWPELRNGLFWVVLRKLSERGYVTIP